MFLEVSPRSQLTEAGPALINSGFWWLSRGGNGELDIALEFGVLVSGELGRILCLGQLGTISTI